VQTFGLENSFCLFLGVTKSSPVTGLVEDTVALTESECTGELWAFGVAVLAEDLVASAKLDCTCELWIVGVEI